MSDRNAHLRGFGPPLGAEAWPQIAESFTPLRSLLSAWLEDCAAARGDELRARVDALGVGLRTYERALTFWAKGADSPLLSSCTELVAAVAGIGRRLLDQGDEGSCGQELTSIGPALLTVLMTMPGRTSLMGVAADTPTPALPFELCIGNYAQLSLALATDGSASAGPTLRALDPAEFPRVWATLALPRPGPWIDLGSGDARSLTACARLAAAREIVGVDLAWSYTLESLDALGEAIEQLPAHARYLVLHDPARPAAGLDVAALAKFGAQLVPITSQEQQFPDRLAARTAATMGAHSAEVVSLLYPIQMQQTGTDGVARPALEFQLATAVKLLKPGGTGLFVTEDVVAWRAAMVALQRNPAVELIVYTSGVVGPAALRAVGVHPYALTMGELDPSLTDPEQISARGPAFGWGLPIVYTTRV